MEIEYMIMIALKVEKHEISVIWVNKIGIQF